MAGHDHDDCTSPDDDFIHLPKQILKKGNIQTLTEFLEEKNLNVNSRIVWGLDSTFVLHRSVDVACHSYHPDFVDFILSQGADCNRLDEKGFAPLHYAVLKSNTTAAEALIKAGADVNLQAMPSCQRLMSNFNKRDSFPLHMATTTPRHSRKAHSFPCCNFAEGFRGPQNLDLVKLLLSSGANCNVLDAQGMAPLHYAVRADDVSAADMLLKSGADINLRSRNENATPLFCVVSKEMLHFLLSKKPDQTILAFNGHTLLFHFIHLKLHKFAMSLLTDSSAINNSSQSNTTPLACAYQQRDELSIKILINSGCNAIPAVLKLSERLSLVYAPDEERFLEIIRQIAYNPRRLFDLCRFKIRISLKANIRMAVSDLQLPEKLKGALCLKDISEDLNLTDD